MFDNEPISRPQLVKKFYFLDYFLILLQSCEKFEETENIFLNFLSLKESQLLGESKYRKLTSEKEEVSEHQVRRYYYTFEQVILESENYRLVKREANRILLSKTGYECLKAAQLSKMKFYLKILRLMEANYFAFFHLIKMCYKQNRVNNGLLIFPIYSPLKLGVGKSDLKTNSDWEDFAHVLKNQMEKDILNFIDKRIDLTDANKLLVQKLVDDKILSMNRSQKFDELKYNSIISRLRKFWLNYFLQNIYNYRFSFDTFNIWVERGKQLGIVHSTEFYPGFDGRLVFPTSIIAKENNNTDLKKFFNYPNGEHLFAHSPNWMDKEVQNTFLECLVNTYFDIKKNRRTHFIRLSDLREKVSYKLRIPGFIFNRFMEESYNLNIKGQTQVQISLEADRLPHETNAMYLKREPILVNGQYKNIIAIDYKKDKV